MFRDKLDDLDAVLVAIARRLRLAGQDSKHAIHDRVLAYRRLGELLGAPQPGERRDLLDDSNRFTQGQKERRWAARHQTTVDPRPRPRRTAAGSDAWPRTGKPRPPECGRGR